MLKGSLSCILKLRLDCDIKFKAADLRITKYTSINNIKFSERILIDEVMLRSY